MEDAIYLKVEASTSKDNTEQTLLFKHFCNCLYLGQWELAKACGLILQVDTTQTIHDIFHDIAKQPFNRSVTSGSISSPCQLSWLCLLECRKTSTSFKHEDVALSEFHLLLLELCPYIADSHLKELYSYYKWVHSSVQTGQSLTLSPGLLGFLQTLLSRQPNLGHSLITSTYDSRSSQVSKNNKALQMVYINAINALLDSITQGDLDEDRKKGNVGKVYDILSLFELKVGTTQLPIRQMFSKVIEHAHQEPDLISKMRITSVLIGHYNLHLLEEFCKVDYDTETNKAVETYQVCAELTEEQRWLLHLSSLAEVNTRWKMFLIFTMKMKRHVLEVIMETGLALIKCSMFTKLKCLMEPRELHPLKPLLLLLGWTHCYSCTEGRELLHTLWTDKSTCDHPAILMGCNKLAYQIDLIQWCLEKAKPLVTEETGGPQFQRASDLFKGLESHSVLYVLQNSTKLSSLDQQEVLELLQKVPLQGQQEEKEKKKMKTVRFQEVENQSETPTTSLDQTKDMAIYTGYCILKNVMDAILFCARCTDKRLTEPIVSRSRQFISNRTVSESSSEVDVSRSNSGMSSGDLTSLANDMPVTKDTLTEKPDVSVQKLYEEAVTHKLQTTKTYLSKLQPLTLRVEILENVFSLLFLTHEDMQETLLNSEYNSDEGDDGKSVRSMSTGAETPAMSPMKMNLQEPKFLADVTDSTTTRTTETSTAYDIPFEDKKLATTDKKLNVVDMQKVGEVLESLKSEIKKRRKITEDGQPVDGRHSSISENISSMSASSSINIDSHGFIANHYLIRDILALLKDCILDVSAARYHIHGNKSDMRERYRSSRETATKCSSDIDPNIEESLCHLVKSSVTMETLQKKITQLERYTSEAHWRYQLVVDEHIPRSPGVVLLDVVMTMGGSSDDEVEIRGTNSSRRRKRRTSVHEGRKSPMSMIEVNSQGVSGSSQSVVISRQSSRVIVARRPGQIRSPKLVSLMLASPVTLLTMSIRKGQLTQTKQIIKLFKLEDRPETVEVYFSQAYQKACRSVQGIMGKDLPVSSSKTGKLGLQAVASAAAAGLATASVTDIADDILKFPTLPQMPIVQNSDSLPQNVAQNFEPHNLPLMILLDLMVTSAKSWDVCNDITNTIRTYLPIQVQSTEANVQTAEQKHSATVSKQRVNKIRTFQNFYTQIQSILQLGAEDEIPSKEQEKLSRTFQKSLQHFLCHSTLSLNADDNKEYATLCQNLSKYVSRVEEAFNQNKVKGQGQSSLELSGRSMRSERLGSTGSVGSRSLREKPVIHHSMKQLIHILEKDVPAAGILALLHRSRSNKQSVRRNYLLSVYEHCKELAFLVEESEAKDKETQVAPTNYFEILEEGPLSILGRMMFMKKMAPAKLEKVAQKLSLNLCHIIVYSCCVKVPSKRLPLLPVISRQEYEMVAGRFIYNCPKVTVTSAASDPEELVRRVLTKLVTLMKDISSGCNAQGLFDRTCADMMTQHTDFYDIINELALLQSADLLHLEKKQRKCFYGNLQSLMTIHCFINQFWMMNAQDRSDVHGPADKLKLYSEMSSTEQILFLSSFSYRLGQLGVVSLFDLKYQINRSGLLAPSEWGRTLEHRLHPLDQLDPWMTMGPSPDSLLLFATTSCCVSSPPVQVLEPSTVREQLASSLKQFLQNCVQIDKESKQVKIPELFLWYRRDFISGQDLCEIAGETDGLVSFIASQLDGDKQRHLQELMKRDEKITRRNTVTEADSSPKFSFEIEVIPTCKDFMCTFNFESMTSAREFHRSLSIRVSHSEDNRHESGMTYSLTPNTLEYIKSDCPLVATLVCLMCSDNIEDPLLDDAFQDDNFTYSNSQGSRDSGLMASLNRSRAASSMSMVDLRSYRYEKLTNEYPALKRHMLNYIIPLAATENSDLLKGDDPILKLLTSDIIERFKGNMLSLHESPNFRTLLSMLLNELFTLRKWREILHVIDSIPVNIVRRQTSLCDLHDFVVCCLIHTQCSVADNKVTLTKEKSEEVMTLLHRMLSTNRQAHEIMSVHEKLLIEHNLELFVMCIRRADLGTNMREVLQRKDKQIKIFYKITECAKNLQIKLSLQGSEMISQEDKLAAQKRHKILEQFTNWRTVVEWTRKSPGEVLALLVKAGCFETAKTWASLEDLPGDIKLEIEEYHVTSLLNANPPNTAQAFMILEKLRADDSSVCLAMCQKFVSVFNKQQDVMFVASYMLNQLSDMLDNSEKDQLRLTHIGSRMILCLPSVMHLEYCHLVATPRYVLEQLLMNMKPDLAGKAFLTVKEEFELVLNPAHKFSMDQFNTLVALYAKKALEFTVIQYLDEKERSVSVRSSSSTDRLDLLESRRESPKLRHSPQPPRHSPQPRHDYLHQKRRSIDLHGSTKLAASAPLSSGSPLPRVMTSVTKEKFVMPSEPPPRDQWVPDSAASVCMVCEVERFSMFNRRHHCRRCGRVVCAACSVNVTPIKGINARTCDDCYKEIVKSSDNEYRGSVPENFYPHQHLSDASYASSHRSSFPNNPMSAAILEEPSGRSLADIVNHCHTAWKLHTDDEYNANLREDFYFEQRPVLELERWESIRGRHLFNRCAMAPSTSLCISILNLHSNGRECGRLILNLCDNLSKFLKPLAPGMPNPEVDYNLIMSMMKYLLFHAKIKFTKYGDNAGMGQCDVYQGLVDLLGLLVVDNFRDLPSLDELMKMDSVRRLRDKLIEDERLPLAMEVSTKCGLDPTGVWVAWGMMCLQSGDFAGAREKFTKCLKAVKDKNSCAPVTSILADIVDNLESMPGTGSMEIQVLLHNPGSVKNLINTPSSTFFEETSMDSQQFQECVYYLRAYGTYLSLVDFHRRHGYYMKAVQYILDHHCSIEVYIEGLLKPCVESGELGRLTDQMLLIDPSLEKWNPYLTASCRYFVRHRLHHVLYEFQIFMKDFIRAGMTCFTYFYQMGAQSYLDLGRRINFLFTAQQHMQAYLDPAHWGNVRHPLSVTQRQGSWENEASKGESVSVRLVKGHEEVSKYIKTIALQIEITKFFQACFTEGQSEVMLGYTGASKIPTLFGSQQIRNDLAIMILLCGESLDTSFALAWRIVKEYKLGAVGIFTHVAREMAKGHQHDNMRSLLGCIEKTDLCTDEVMDEILGACLLVVADNQSEAKEAENIIKMLRKDANKINAYILCGKLRSAYLMAVKENRTDDVKRILRAAKSMGQSAVVNICNKWLDQNKT